MKAKFVNENFLYESTYIPIGDTRDLREIHKIFKTPLFGILANELQTIPNNCVNKDEKLDIDKFYDYLKTNKKISYSFNDVKRMILDMAAALNFTNRLKLTKEEKSDIKFKEKMINGNFSLIDFIDKFEIDKPELDSDRILRSADGTTTPAFYRLPKIKNLKPEEINMLKAHYAMKYGLPDRTPFENYRMARPISKGSADKNNRSYYRTFPEEEFIGEEYD